MSVCNARERGALDAAVASILGQSLENIELIVYDDGSDEAGGRLLVDVLGWDEAEQISRRDERVRLIAASEHRGIAYGLNRCIDISVGRYIARMDADDVSEVRRLEVQTEWLREHPDAAFAGSAAYLFDADGIWGERRLPESPVLYDYMKYSPYIHPTVMFRREVFETRRYEESTVAMECEDYELFLRLYTQGVKGGNLTQPLYRYREDIGSYQRRPMRRRVRELKVRYRYFAHSDVPLLRRAAAIMRPVAGGLIPNRLIYGMKRRECGYA